MIAEDEDALVCDFAETYHVLDYRSLPARLSATLAAGLPDDSRIKRKLSDTPCDVNTLLLALITDRLSYLVWMQTDDARKNKNRPDSIYLSLIGKTEKKTSDVMSFETGDDFEKAWVAATGGE